MSEPPFFAGLAPERIDPERLRLVLQESGWAIAGQRSGAYVRLSPPEGSESSVLVPMDREAPEYVRSMQAALEDIRRLASTEIWANNVSARLVIQPSDSFRFRAETAAPSGLIPWNRGEELITSARRVLVAGAKTHIEHLKYYGNRFGRFASRYLDNVLMGQTAPGSYIVTAYTPANGIIPLTSSKASTTPLFTTPSEVASTRDVGLTVLSAAAASREALDHYRRSGSLAAFEELVQAGVSYEMTTALNQLVSDSAGADISVEWDPALEPPQNVPASRIEFYPADVEVLTRASHQLAVSDESFFASIMGRVHLLSQSEAGGPGVVGIENLSTARPKKIRVHLGDEDYHRALRAHDHNEAVVVEGRIQRDGNLFWIYNGSLVSVVGSLDEIVHEISKRPLPDDDSPQLDFEADDGDEGLTTNLPPS